jgi:branched-chain amino acid transport system substrate-binding protein
MPRINISEKNIGLLTTFALIIVIICLWILVSQIVPPSLLSFTIPISQRISFGNHIFVNFKQDSDFQKRKKDGQEAMMRVLEAKTDSEVNNLFQKSKVFFEQARNLAKKESKEFCADPELLIYKNNAQIGNSQAYTIAVVVPMENAADSALEILRGVAQAQEEFNNDQQKINGKKLRVIIANEKDEDLSSTQTIANTLGNPKYKILGVVGHFSSGATEVAALRYRAHKLVSISPTSTGVDIAGGSEYFFRTVPNDKVAAMSLAKYMMENQRITNKKVAIFYGNGKYSESLSSNFINAVKSLQGVPFNDNKDQIYNMESGFVGAKAYEKAINNGVQVFMFAIPSYLRDKVFSVTGQEKAKRYFFLGGDGMYGTNIQRDLVAQAGTMVFALPWHYSIDSTRSKEFVKKSSNLWCQPQNSEEKVTWRTATAYDATNILIEALKQHPTRQGVQKYLKQFTSQPTAKLSFEGVTGKISFNNHGDLDSGTRLVQLKENKFELLDTTNSRH